MDRYFIWTRRGVRAYNSLRGGVGSVSDLGKVVLWAGERGMGIVPMSLVYQSMGEPGVRALIDLSTHPRKKWFREVEPTAAKVLRSAGVLLYPGTREFNELGEEDFPIGVISSPNVPEKGNGSSKKTGFETSYEGD